MKKWILLKSKVLGCRKSKISEQIGNVPSPINQRFLVPQNVVSRILLGRKKIIFLFLILGILFISGCKNECDSDLYTSDSKCCTYVCDIGCPDDYKEGTCNCECEAAGEDSGVGDVNIDDIFDDTTDIEPPSIPI